tara:strand:+ start:183 stop:431 length:249 start_codon:yes stop_codon:yes gene_type:complete
LPTIKALFSTGIKTTKRQKSGNGLCRFQAQEHPYKAKGGFGGTSGPKTKVRISPSFRVFEVVELFYRIHYTKSGSNLHWKTG